MAGAPSDDPAKRPPADPATSEVGRDPETTPPRDPDAPDDDGVVPGTVAARVAADAQMTDLSLELRVSRLPREQQLVALLGLTRDMQVAFLPNGFKAVQIIAPRDRTADVERIAEASLAFPVGSDFKGNPRDGSIVQTYVIPSQEGYNPNYDRLVQALESNSIGAEIFTTSNRPAVVRAKGNSLNLIGPDFSEGGAVATAASIQRMGRPGGSAAQIPENIRALTRNLSRASYEVAKDDVVNIPRKGSCTYMLLEDTFADQLMALRAKADSEEPDGKKEQDLMLVLKQISHIFRSANFHISRYGRFLVIVNTSERGGSFLTSMAKGLEKSTEGKTLSVIGKGEIIHKNRGKKYEIKGFMGTQLGAEELSNLPNGTYIQSAMYNSETQRLTGRDGGQHITKTEASLNRNLLRVIEHIPFVKLKIGGPDVLVGCKEELPRMNELLNDATTRLIIVKALAGMGKSALLDEVEKTHPSMVTTSIDPSQSHIQGGGLVRVLEQIIGHVERNKEEGDTDPCFALLDEFQNKSGDKKITEAQKTPQELTALCIQALEYLHGKLGPLQLIIDDLHHIDNHSDSHVWDIIGHLATGSGGDKAVVAHRPEETGITDSRRKVMNLIGKQGVRSVNVNGPDFGDRAILEEWIMHSLPENVREGNHLAGEEWETLGKRAGNFPLAMVTYMDEMLLQEQEAWKQRKVSVLRISEGEIRLSSECLASLLEKIPSGSDLDRYYEAKQDKLPTHLQNFMQSIALLGGTVSEAQITAICSAMGQPVTPDEIKDVLIAQKYLVQTVDGKKYSFKHQTISETVIDSMESVARVDLAFKLYKSFKKDQSIAEDVKLRLLHIVAPHVKADNKSFWAEYSERVNASLDSISESNSYEHGHALTVTVLGDCKKLEALPPNQGTAIQQTVTKLRTEENAVVSPEMGSMVVKSLMGLGRDAMMVGQLNEAGLALKFLEEIAKKNPPFIEDMKAVYLLELQYFYVTKDGEGMSHLYENKLNNGADLEPAERAVYEIQIAYRANVEGTLPNVGAITEVYDRDMEACPEIKNPDHPHHKQFLEILRLTQGRIPFEVIKHHIVHREGKKFDEDVMYQPKALTSEQIKQLGDIEQSLELLFAKRKQDPTIFTPYGEMGLLDLNAEVKAMLGNYPEAISAASEFWRQANHMGMHEEAARAAKIKGDVQMIQGLLSSHQINRERVLEAIRTYGEEGIKSLAGVEEKTFNKLALRVQRIRAVGVLSESYLQEIETRVPQIGEREQMKNVLKEHLGVAFEDFKYISEEFPGRARSGEIQYYLMSYMGYVMQAASEFDIRPSYDINDSPYANPDNFSSGCSYAEMIVPDVENNADLREKPRKQKGQGYMKNYIQPQREL